METKDIEQLVQGIIADNGVSRRIKEELEKNLETLSNGTAEYDPVSEIISILDDASSHPHLSMGARTQIWNIVSALEMGKK